MTTSFITCVPLAIVAVCSRLLLASLQPTHTPLHTQSWIEGEKLSESTADDVRTLCNTLLNCYLIQLLQTRLLHSDPHPGLCCQYSACVWSVFSVCVIEHPLTGIMLCHQTANRCNTHACYHILIV